KIGTWPIHHEQQRPTPIKQFRAASQRVHHSQSRSPSSHDLRSKQQTHPTVQVAHD
ncbi:hypothetical protein ACLOJK_026930, partial [Asimina triloba]